MGLFGELDLQILAFIQGLGSWLNPIMQFFSFLGNEYFFILLMPVLYWCVDVGVGVRVGVMLISSTALYNSIKIGLHKPRPYWYSSRVQIYSHETSFCPPSGHATTAASFWGRMAVEVKRRWFSFLMIFIIFMIGISRVYLGVHHPSSVLLGWLFGSLLMGLFTWVNPKLSAWLKQKPLWLQVLLAFLSSLFFVALWLGVRAATLGFVIPQLWFDNGGAIDPFNPETVFSMAGVWFGMLGGFAWLLNVKGKTLTAGPFPQLLSRFLWGVLGIALFWFGLGKLIPEGTTPVLLILRYLRYALIGLWVSALAPLLFEKLKLVKFEKPA